MGIPSAKRQVLSQQGPLGTLIKHPGPQFSVQRFNVHSSQVLNILVLVPLGLLCFTPSWAAENNGALQMGGIS